MATGFYDANGIWNYGEDDNIALFSDTLNKLADSTSDAFTSDRSRISTLESGNLAGLIPVKPVSVAVAGGTAAVNTLGVVTFTNATSLSLNNVFTSNYDNYKIHIVSVASTSPTQLSFRLRVSGADSSTLTYNRSAINQLGNSGVVAWWDANAAQAGISVIQDTHKNYSVIELADVTKASRTTALFQSRGYSGSTGYFAGAILHSETVAYDGITISPGANSFTGTIQVFGYND